MKSNLLFIASIILIAMNGVTAAETINVTGGTISSGTIKAAIVKDAGTSGLKVGDKITGAITKGTISVGSINGVTEYTVTGTKANAALTDVGVSKATISNVAVDTLLVNDKKNPAITEDKGLVLENVEVVHADVNADFSAPAKNNSQTIPQAASSNDNYLGDCFKVPFKTSEFEPGWYRVLSQEKGTDKLALLRVKSQGFVSCPADELDDANSPKLVVTSANTLMNNGALRTGWVYGTLILPFKYHFNDKSFSSETTIGPYIGRRSTVGASSFIWAFSAGLTPIKVDSADQNGNAKSTSLTAFTLAGGLMFELDKGASPFRAGIFFGRDRVSSDSAVTYKHDRKNWMALQLGYDFVAK